MKKDIKEKIQEELKKRNTTKVIPLEEEKMGKKQSSKSNENKWAKMKNKFYDNTAPARKIIAENPRLFKITKYTIGALVLLTIGYNIASWQSMTRIDAGSGNLSEPFSLSYRDVTKRSLLTESPDAIATTIANSMIKLDKDTKTNIKSNQEKYDKIKNKSSNISEGQLTFNPIDYRTESGLKAMIFAGKTLEKQINDHSKTSDIQKLVKDRGLSNQQVGIVVINKSLYDKSTDIQSAINENKKLVDENKFDDIGADNTKIVKLNKLSLNDPAFFETFIYTTDGLMKKVMGVKKDQVIEFDTMVNQENLHIIIRGLQDNTLSEKSKDFDKTTKEAAKTIAKINYVDKLTNAIDKDREYPAEFRANVIKHLETLIGGQ